MEKTGRNRRGNGKTAKKLEYASYPEIPRSPEKDRWTEYLSQPQEWEIQDGVKVGGRTCKTGRCSHRDRRYRKTRMHYPSCKRRFWN